MNKQPPFIPDCPTRLHDAAGLVFQSLGIVSGASSEMIEWAWAEGYADGYADKMWPSDDRLQTDLKSCGQEALYRVYESAFHLALSEYEAQHLIRSHGSAGGLT